MIVTEIFIWTIRFLSTRNPRYLDIFPHSDNRITQSIAKSKQMFHYSNALTDARLAKKTETETFLTFFRRPCLFRTRKAYYGFYKFFRTDESPTR